MGREVFGQASEPVYSKPNWECSAFGCYLPGGLSPAFGVEAKYYCRFHYGKESHQNDWITAKLKRYKTLFDGAYAIRSVADVLKIANHFDQLGRADLMPKEDEVYFPDYYKTRLLVDIGREVFEELKAE
jgi:hypothetical protein